MTSIIVDDGSAVESESSLDAQLPPALSALRSLSMEGIGAKPRSTVKAAIPVRSCLCFDEESLCSSNLFQALKPRFKSVSSCGSRGNRDDSVPILDSIQSRTKP
jgi:hypothetical protein